MLTGKSTAERPLGRPNEDNIRMDLIETDVNMKNLTDLVQEKDYWKAFGN